MSSTDGTTSGSSGAAAAANSTREDDLVVITEPVAGVAQVTLNRPARMNALSPQMFAALVAAGEQLMQRQDLAVVVLHGQGKAFCAGLDLSTFAAVQGAGARDAIDPALVPTPGRLAQRTHGLANLYQQVAWVWRSLPVPVLAAVHGVAFGGGLQIALGADVRYIAPQTRMSVMEMRWGLVPDMAGMALMRGLVRDDLMRELVYTARIVEADEAVAIGLATRVVDDPLAVALQAAAQIAQQSRSATRAAKRLLNLQADATQAQILVAESVEQDALLGSPEQMAMVMRNLPAAAKT